MGLFCTIGYSQNLFCIGISSNATTYTDLSKTLLQVKVKIMWADGSDIGPDDDVALVNLALSSLFGQCDVSLNQRTINTSVGSNYPYKAYFDVIVDSFHYEAETVRMNYSTKILLEPWMELA